MKLKSLRSRMTAMFAIAFAALILIFGTFILWFARHTSERDAHSTLQTAASKMQREYSEARQEQDNDGWSDEQVELTQQNLALVIVNAEGHVTPITPGKVPPWPPLDRQHWLIQTVALGSKTAVLGFHWQKTESTLRSQALMLVGLCLTLLLAAIFGVWLLIGRTLLPIYELSVQADAASLEYLHVRMEATSQDTEIVHLVGTLNGLLERLSGAISARERFYAAASHELRTPLQTLNGYLELALMRERSVEDYRAVLTEAYAQSESLSSLVQALLLLNQLEATSVHEKQTFDLGEVCARWTEEFTSLAESRGIRFIVCPSEMCCVEAMSSYLDILLRNLLENGVKYAITDSEVHICIEILPKGTSLTIFNQCAPLPEWNEEKLFEPFYRPDASRNSDTGGNGLGLAICKAIAVANDWDLSLKQGAGGVQAKVTFPPRVNQTH